MSTPESHRSKVAPNEYLFEVPTTATVLNSATE
jgi:hypothetical protein